MRLFLSELRDSYLMEYFVVNKNIYKESIVRFKKKIIIKLSEKGYVKLNIVGL